MYHTLYHYILSFLLIVPTTQSTYKMNKEELRAFQENYKIIQEMLDIYKTYPEYISSKASPEMLTDFKKQLKLYKKEALLVKEHLKKIKAQKATKTQEEGEEIPKKQFGTTVRGVLDKYISAIGKKIDKENLRTIQLKENEILPDYLFSSANNHPVVAAVRDALNNSLKASARETLAVAYDNLAKALASFTPERIEKEYYNRKLYGGSVSESNVEKIFPPAEYIAEAFSNLADKEDPNHPENVKKKEQQIVEALKEARISFKRRFENQYNAQLDALDAIAVRGDTGQFELQIVDLWSLKKNKNMVDYPPFAKEMWEEIYQNVLKGMQEKQGFMTVAETKDLIQRLLQAYNEQTYMDQLFEAYRKNQMVMVLPRGFAVWVNRSSLKIDVETFERIYLDEWHKEVLDVVNKQELDLAKKGSRPQISRAALVKNMKLVFGQSLPELNSQPGLAIFKELLAELPKEERFSYPALDTAWKTALMACRNPVFMRNLCQEYIINKTDNMLAMETAIDSIGAVLPNAAALMTAMQNAHYWKQQPVLIKGNSNLNCSTHLKFRYITEEVGDVTMATIPGGALLPKKMIKDITTYLDSIFSKPVELGFDFELDRLQRKGENGEAWAFATLAGNLDPNSIVSYNTNNYDLSVVSIISSLKEIPEAEMAETTIKVRCELKTENISFSFGVSGIVASGSMTLPTRTNKQTFDLVFKLTSKYDKYNNLIIIENNTAPFSFPEHILIDKVILPKVPETTLSAFEKQ